MRKRDCAKGHYYGKLTVLLITCFLFAIIIVLALSEPVYAIEDNLHISPAGVPSFFPAVITSPDGHGVYVAWSSQLEDGYSDVLISSSTDGIHFSNETTNISNSSGIDSLNVRLASVGSNIYAVWQEDYSKYYL